MSEETPAKAIRSHARVIGSRASVHTSVPASASVSDRLPKRTRLFDSEVFGYLEVCIFAFIFILVFSAIARADDQGGTLGISPGVVGVSANGTVQTGVQHKSAGAQAATEQNQGSDSTYGTSGGTQIFGTTLNSRVIRKRTPKQRALDTSQNNSWSFVGAFTTEAVRNLNPSETTSYSGSYTVLTGAIYKPWDVSLSTEVGFSQEYSYSQEEDGRSGAFDNPMLRVQKRFLNRRDFNSRWIDDIRLLVTSSLPANRSAGRQSFQGSVGPSVNFDKHVWRFNLTQGFGYSRGFYEYDMDDAGIINSPDVFKSMSLVSTSITDSLAWTNSFLYAYAIDFRKVGKATQIFTSSVDCYWTSRFSTSLGVMTNRGTLDADGRTNRILIFDQNSSVAFLDLGWKI